MHVERCAGTFYARFRICTTPRPLATHWHATSFNVSYSSRDHQYDSRVRNRYISSHITLFLRISLLAPTIVGSPQYPPHSARAQEPQGVSTFTDGCGPIFSKYLEMATEEDKKMAESWKADADGILIFVCLYHLFVLQTDSNIHRPVYSLLPSHH